MKTGLAAWNVEAGISAPPASARSTLRSVKLLIELPACSKNAQNSIEKNISTSATNSRSRSTRAQRSASNSRNASAPPPNSASTAPAMALRCTQSAIKGSAIATLPATGAAERPAADAGALPAPAGSPPRPSATAAIAAAAASASATKALTAS